MPRKAIRWQDMDHSEEPLISYVMLRPNQTRTDGPLSEFLAKKQAEQEPKTYEWYEDSLHQFWAFVEPLGLTKVGDLTVGTANRFRVHLRQRRLSENTISNRMRAVRAFARWMHESGWTERNQLEGLKVPQSNRPRFDLIKDEERAEIFNLYNPHTFMGSRNLAMLAVLSETGLRREELVNILAKDADLDAQVMRVYSDKTEEWRFVPLTDECVVAIRNYLKWRERYFQKRTRPRAKPGQEKRTPKQRQISSDRLFVSWKGTTMRPESVTETFRRISAKLGFRTHAHWFRHDWATRKAIDGENPSIVRRWAGHKTFAMTDYYFDMADEMLGAIKPKKSVLAGISQLRSTKRGRPPKNPAS